MSETPHWDPVGDVIAAAPERGAVLSRANAAADEWLVSGGFSVGTRGQYTLAWRSWLCFCATEGINPLACKRKHFNGFINELRDHGNPAVHPDRRKPLSARSQLRHISTISSFYEWALDEDDGAVTSMHRSPVAKRDRPKTSRESEQPYLSPDELRRLLAVADARFLPTRRKNGEPKPGDGGRAHALVALLLLACLRVSEALSLRCEDIREEGDQYFVYVTRKGDKRQRVPIPPAAFEALDRACNGRTKGPLIATRTGKPLDRKGAWRLVERLGMEAGIRSAIGPHTLRHAYITRGHELQLDATLLQKAAGHTSIETTRLYDRRGFDPKTHPSYRIAADLAGNGPYRAGE